MPHVQAPIAPARLTSGTARVTLVHERFTEYAGSEAVVEQLAREWPAAPILAPIGRAGVLPADLEARLRTTQLTRFLRGTSYAHLLPALPVAMANLSLPPSDVVIASHHAFATQVVRATQAPVIAYVHTPARWVWDAAMRTGEAGGRSGEAMLGAFSAVFRPRDRAAAARLQTVVANSSFVAERIRTWWDREAAVVHPPVDTEYYSPSPATEREDFFLLAGRLVPYKRPDLAIRAAERAGVPLVVTGGGRIREEMARLAGPHTRFVGRVDDDELRDLFRRCRALLMPGVEDFGIVPVEAQACGAPVIAIDAGGARDSVLPGRTGELVPVTSPEQEVETWASTLAAFDPSLYDSRAIRAHAETFSRRHFREAMAAVVDRTLAAH
ncbi:glycosyltransferase family 4 protein [Modestobacter muralis]|uniref:Glycosyltransferase family 4 protein n=1 Tax=Modestobacter muralis TaxID=1608614 RepID=A0A6P0H964_9ACTN|nr:glycosyltransferase [Modestobacter muralis]NEK94468.1 glycosyltransferase family 4 protein [Modestobacter muralis]NEN51356.1 glycosyltransferase family 4 protein [Modestobacter muralis]